MSFSEFIRSPNRDNRTIISSGLYYQHFQRFEKYFDRDQFCILLYEDLKERPVESLQRIYSFLDVDPSFSPDTETRLNVSWGFQYLDLLRALNRPFQWARPNAGGTPLTWLWKNSRHFRQLFWKKNSRPPSMNEADRAYLRDLYAEPNARLEAYLDRDLSHWR
jgi:hypothetical protein